MKSIIALAIALALAGNADAQSITAGQTVVSGSESNSNANSGSVSGSTSVSDQQQGQSQGLQNSNSASTSAQQGNQQATSLVFEASTIPTDTTVNWKGNTTVALAAGVSFSSDYCGGTASAGASAAGVSIGGAKPIMDGNCQAMRRAEKFGVAAANAHNMGFAPLAANLLAMQVWEICQAGNDAKVSSTAEACVKLGLVGPGSMPHDPPSHNTLPADPPPAAQPKAQQGTTIRGSDGRSVTIPPDARVPRGG